MCSKRVFFLIPRPKSKCIPNLQSCPAIDQISYGNLGRKGKLPRTGGRIPILLKLLLRMGHIEGQVCRNFLG